MYLQKNAFPKKITLYEIEWQHDECSIRWVIQWKFFELQVANQHL